MNTQFLTQVWCLPGMTKARLSLFPQIGENNSVTLSLEQTLETINALKEAARRMTLAEMCNKEGHFFTVQKNRCARCGAILFDGPTL